MKFRINFSLIVVLIITLFVGTTTAQIVFKELPDYQIKTSDSVFFDITQTRNIIPLNGKWQVYSSDDEDKNRVSVTVPSLFEGEGDLVFEKRFDIPKQILLNHNFKIYFFGINYRADISVNDVIIYRHSGGEFPFQIELPKDILNIDKPNLLTIDLNYKLDSENTIPVKQRFLFPKNYGGILRDVFIKSFPNISINETNLETTYFPGNGNAELKFKAQIKNKEFTEDADSLTKTNPFDLRLTLSSMGIADQVYEISSFKLSKNEIKDIEKSISIKNPEAWSTDHPKSYKVSIELWRDETLIDKSLHSIAFYSLLSEKDSLSLNRTKFNFNGVTYIPSFGQFGPLATYKEMENDIVAIKNLGINSVRFTKTVPHPYYLKLCQQYGLLAFVEIPLNSIPEALTQNENFIDRSENYLTGIIKAYNRYSAVAAFGVGGSFVPDIEAHNAFIQDLCGVIKEKTNKLTYASFFNSNISDLNNLDIYGVELFNQTPDEIQAELKNLQIRLGNGKVFISSATYTVTKGNTDGYVNKHSYEAQAKYYEDLLDYAKVNPLAGYFINTMFDYRGDYSSLSNGYNSQNLYTIGIVSEERNPDRIGYKVIHSKLNNTEAVTIPIGSQKDDAPMVFIIFGIAFAILMGILINSGRKFREDASRALLRPYNFYADVRDQRILSGYHATFLGIIIAAVLGLIFANLLFYFKNNIVVEKYLLAFGSPEILKGINYLAWHPLASLVYLSISFAILFLVLTIIIKSASLFIRNRVFSSNIYFGVVWSFLPVVLLIPVGIILYRLLVADIINIYVYIVLALFGIWILYRLVKGVYVIFDVNPGSVYFYSIIFILLLLGGIIIYYEFTNSVIDYISLTIKQFK